MPTIVPDSPDTSQQARRKGGRPSMRSFTWVLSDGDEISGCVDCSHWHARVESDGDDYHPTTYLREWHAADCPCWEADV